MKQASAASQGLASPHTLAQAARAQEVQYRALIKTA
jgi:hypothetical protein